MKISLRLVVLALVAIAALEFAILGVDARTGDGGGVSSLPLVGHRTLVEPGDPTSISLEADPETIDCTGQTPSVVTATVTDQSDQPVPDGTVVTFSVVAVGTSDPVNTQTIDGVASSNIKALRGIENGVTVIVSSGDASSSIRLNCEGAGVPGQPRAIELRSTPDEITCDGYDEAKIRVRVRDGDDQPVPDGTYVEFWIEGHGYGRFSEWQVATRRGEASTQVSFQSFSQFEPYGFYVHAAAGRLEGAIRVYCAPSDPVCVSPPLSPPEHPLSPPCEVPPPPQSPPECVENPPSPPTSVSPPCVEPPQSPPDCVNGGLIPITLSSHCPQSPPIGECVDFESGSCAPTPTRPPSPPGDVATPTPTPGGGGLPIPSDSIHFLLDCDVQEQGVQDSCEIPAEATTLTVGIILENNYAPGLGLDSVDVEVIAANASFVEPIDREGGQNGNPDFVATGLSPDEWGCVATPDSAPDDDNVDSSRLVCFRNGSGVNIEGGEAIEFARVVYTVKSTPVDEEIELRIGRASAGANGSIPVGSCLIEQACSSLTVTIAGGPERTSTPTATATPPHDAAIAVESSDLTATPEEVFFSAIDCDLGRTGVQDRCTYRTDDELIEVGFVIVNNATFPDAVSSFDFVLDNPDRSRLDPPAVIGGHLDANPDFHESSHDDSWACVPPPPDNNRLPEDSTASESFLSCFSPGSAFSVIQPGGYHLGATIRYRVPDGAQPGVVELTQGFGGAGNPTGVPLLSCSSAGPNPTCLPATITLIDVDAPEATSTPTAVPTSTPTAPGGVSGPPAATSTATPTPTSEPQEACADVTGDGLVTSKDVSAIAKHVGKSYDERYDVNGDGKVSVRDVIAAIMQRGRRC